MNMNKIAIYGAGGLGREVLSLIRQINLSAYSWDTIGFFDDALGKDTKVNGLSVLGNIEFLNRWEEEIYIVIAIGNTEAKKKLVAKIANPNVKFATLVHPDVALNDFQNINIGQGSIITEGNILTTDIIIGKHVLLNLACTVGHDVKIGDYSSIMPGCHISGEVKMGEGSYLGTGAVIINKMVLGDFATIGAGAVVINNVRGHTTSVGVPAREK